VAAAHGCSLSTVITILKNPPAVARDYGTRLPRDRLCFLSGRDRFAIRWLAIIVSNPIALTDSQRRLLNAIDRSIEYAPCPGPPCFDNRRFLDPARWFVRAAAIHIMRYIYTYIYIYIYIYTPLKVFVSDQGYTKVYHFLFFSLCRTLN